ncbi:hypothetical protein QR680_013949 [Steinernema hermaphroditum]|uniref:Metalloendopeptidase n=1 Tax=Steinernema hermaphroditum TaxID=289476 RepID=A0AA39I779_9BILA|nr:hypothetical protein QR680_013949 [Steinernema hermaphroditum]
MYSWCTSQRIQSYSCLLLFFLFTPTFAIVKRNAINPLTYPERLWQTDRPIPYTFADDFLEKDRQVIRTVFESVASKTCLSFKDLSNSTSKEITETTLYFVNSTEGCSSRIGKNEEIDLQEINLQELGCRQISTYYHELFHALGLDHTQNRDDRDDYLTFYANHTQPERVYNFDKLTTEDINSFGVPYDFDSVMHYEGGDFLNDENRSNLVALDELYQHAMGTNRYGAAHSDYLLLNRLYSCFDRCATVKTICQNGGFVNPNKCHQCICPRGFGGAFCEEPELSGLLQCAKITKNVKTLTAYRYAADFWQTLKITGNWKGDRDSSCYWHLKASAEKQIEMELVDYQMNGELAWLEVRLGNFEVGGYKFFNHTELPDEPMTSEENHAVITLAPMGKAAWFKLRYRSVFPENTTEEEYDTKDEEENVQSVAKEKETKRSSSVFAVSIFLLALIIVLL